MHAVKFGIAVVVVALSWNAATAQPPPSLGGPIPPGQLFGYSPLVHSVEPFPSKTSPYAPSMFLPGVGGKRLPTQLVIDPRRPSPSCNAVIIEVRDAPRFRPAPPVMQAVAFSPAGPVVRPLPVQGMHRFDR
jgi:hypothetical protein